MRKRIINQEPQNVAPVDQRWLDLQRLAQVELTSEDAAQPDRGGADTQRRIGLAGGTSRGADDPPAV